MHLLSSLSCSPSKVISWCQTHQSTRVDQHDHFTHAFAGYVAKVLRSTKNKTQTTNLLRCGFRIIQRIMDREEGRLLSECSSIVSPHLRIDEKAFKSDFQSFLSNVYHLYICISDIYDIF